MRKSCVVYRRENPIWEFGSESRNTMEIYNHFYTGKVKGLVCLGWGLQSL